MMMTLTKEQLAIFSKQVEDQLAELESPVVIRNLSDKSDKIEQLVKQRNEIAGVNEIILP